MSVKEDKDLLRKKYKALRSEMPHDVREALDRSIFENVISLDEYKRCDLVLTYVSAEIEVDTVDLIKQAFHDGKIVAAPRSLDKCGKMAFYEIRSFDDLEKGYFGISEPIAGKCREISCFDRGICIVPALSYDAEGYRLGYGKGYYDRFLSAHKELCRIGICYSVCMEKLLPHGEFDIPADIVVTEKIAEYHRKEKDPDGK